MMLIVYVYTFQFTFNVNFLKYVISITDYMYIVSNIQILIRLFYDCFLSIKMKRKTFTFPYLQLCHDTKGFNHFFICQITLLDIKCKTSEMRLLMIYALLSVPNLTTRKARRVKFKATTTVLLSG